MKNLQVTQVQGVNATELIQAIAQAVKIELQTAHPQPAPYKDDEIFLSRKEVAKMLGVSDVTVYNWTKSEILTKHRIGNAVRYKKDEVLTALKSNK